jgi:CRISPR system Cascade subunit CasC
LARALAEATPRGKQNSHGHHPRAYFIRAERGTRAPRDLSGAFFTPVNTKLAQLGVNNLESASVKALEKAVADLDAAYGPCCAAHELMHVGHGGTLDAIAAFAAGSV